jgi:hypothetical protein
VESIKAATVSAVRLEAQRIVRTSTIPAPVRTARGLCLPFVGEAAQHDRGGDGLPSRSQSHPVHRVGGPARPEASGSRDCLRRCKTTGSSIWLRSKIAGARSPDTRTLIDEYADRRVEGCGRQWSPSWSAPASYKRTGMRSRRAAAVAMRAECHRREWADDRHGYRSDIGEDGCRPMQIIRSTRAEGTEASRSRPC